MDSYYLLAAILCILLGFFHSFLGEYLIFRNQEKIISPK